MGRRAAAFGALIIFLAVGCGSGGGNTFDCLMGSGTSQLCIETMTNVPGSPTCGTGMLVSACSHAGADGACVQSFAADGTSLSQTIWYYSGSAASTSQEMSDCTDNGGTWKSP